MSKSTTCSECGQRLESVDTKHTLEDCGKYHLKRALEILEPRLNRAGTQKARGDAEYVLKVLTVLERLLEKAK